MSPKEHIATRVAVATDNELSVGHLISRARTSLLSSLDTELGPLGMTGAQFTVLKNLADGPGETAADLSRMMHYDTGSMTRLLDRLEEKGFVRRERCTNDRRVVYLRMTSAGRAHLPRLRIAALRVLDAHLAGFTAGEVDNLRQYLGRMIENGQRPPAAH
jgi:DNA-binding MarR family transcriptional regulator